MYFFLAMTVLFVPELYWFAIAWGCVTVGLCAYDVVILRISNANRVMDVP